LTFTFYVFAGPALRGPIFTIFGLWGHITNVIAHVTY